MSETTEAAAATETDAPAATTEPPASIETAVETPAAELSEPSEPTAPVPGDEPWRKVRIEQMAAQKNHALREADLAKRERDEARELLKAYQEGQNPDGARATQAQIRAEASRIAAEEIAAREQDTKNTVFVKAGRAAFQDFDDRCAVVASAGATARPEFMAIIGDMDDGPRVVMHLADHPTEAVRILNLPAHLMGLELAKLERAVQPKAAPKPVTAAPRPPTPVGGQTVGARDIADPGLSMREYVKLRETQIREREAARR